MEAVVVVGSCVVVYYFVVRPLAKAARESIDRRRAAAMKHLYRYSSPHQTFVLDFSTMRLTKGSAVRSLIMSGSTDGEAMYSISKDEQEVGPGVLEVRRVSPTEWETRLDWDSFEKRKAHVWKKANATFSPDGTYTGFGPPAGWEELTGVDYWAWVAWVKAGKEGERPAEPEAPPARSWKTLPDEFTPAVETAYQRYINNG